MGKLGGSFRCVIQVAKMSLLCVPLLCAASARTEPCQPCADETVAEGAAPSKPPGPAVAPAARQIAAEEGIESESTSAEPAEPAKVENNAIAAALADGVTTKLALAAGGIEGNALAAGFPLGLVALTGAKVLLVKYAETLPETDKRIVIKTTSAAWGGAAVNNLLVMLAAPPPLSIMAGIVMGIIAWRHTASQYDNQDRVAALQREKQDRLAAMPKEQPALTAPGQAKLEMAQVAIPAGN